MAAQSYVYLVRLGDAAIRAYTDKKQLAEFLRSLPPHLLQRYLIQRLEIGDIEQGLHIKAAVDVLALWEMAR
jgi:hypothetical protein